MNTIDKIIKESKTNKQASEKIYALAQKFGDVMTEIEAAQFVKGYKLAKPQYLAAANGLLKLEAEYNRDQTIKYLANHLPLNTIDNIVTDLDNDIADWADKVKKSPDYYLSWGEGAFKDAAKRLVLITIRGWLDQVDFMERYDDPEFWPELQKHVAKQAIDRASNMPSSTSQASNLMESRITEAWAGAARSCFNQISRIAHWFSTKAELNITMAEIIQAGEADKIDISKLAQNIGL